MACLGLMPLGDVVLLSCAPVDAVCLAVIALPFPAFASWEVVHHVGRAMPKRGHLGV